ncbi:MAG: hypothetical protein LCH41_07895 [Armatimonadetes bacterium]|nr:hypothetical protein [Armatimonadota bacterium]
MSADSAALENEIDSLIHGAARLSLSDTQVLKMTGEDRRGWLQGQITQDIRDLRSGGSVQTCFCTPTGQLRAFATVYDLDDALYLVSAQMDVIADRIENLVILEDVCYEMLPGTLESIQGGGASDFLDEAFELPALDSISAPWGYAFRRDRTGLGGWDILTDDQTALSGLETLTDEALNALEIEAGLPRFGTDTSEKTLPPELGKAFEDAAINYRKGCYTGQEVLQRIHSRGHTNKTWMAVLAESRIEAGDAIVDGGQTVGTIHRVAWHPRLGWIGTTTVRNASAREGHEVMVQSPAGREISADLSHFPLA